MSFLVCENESGEGLNVCERESWDRKMGSEARRVKKRVEKQKEPGWS